MGSNNCIRIAINRERKKKYIKSIYIRYKFYKFFKQEIKNGKRNRGSQ